MLKKKFLPKEERKSFMFKMLNEVFQTSVNNLSAEYIMLHKAETADIETFMNELRRISIIDFPFTAECVSGRFMKHGRFTCFDERQAVQYIFNTKLNFWLNAVKDQVGEEEIKAFRQDFYYRYFSKLAGTTPCEEAEKYVYYVKCSNEQIMNQNKVLKGIIAGYLGEGDNVLYYLCPLYPRFEYRITVDNCTPFFRRLVELQGSNIFLRNDDIKSADFIMAMFEGTPFFLQEHSLEILKRAATLLLAEGKKI